MADLRSADLMINNLLSDPIKIEELKADPQRTLRSAADEATSSMPLKNDVWIYRMVVGFLGGVVVVVALGLIALPFAGQATTPDGLIGLGSAAVGALAGLLAPSPMR